MNLHLDYALAGGGDALEFLNKIDNFRFVENVKI